ncbi:MAG: hypothetical protein ACTS3R_14665 [Inquilinaceae bacterium]
MNEVQKLNLRQAGEWLSGEIEIRVARKWLAIGGVVFVALAVIAID